MYFKSPARRDGQKYEVSANESGKICCDITKATFGSVILLKAKRPGEYILAIFPEILQIPLDYSKKRTFLG